MNFVVIYAYYAEEKPLYVGKSVGVYSADSTLRNRHNSHLRGCLAFDAFLRKMIVNKIDYELRTLQVIKLSSHAEAIKISFVVENEWIGLVKPLLNKRKDARNNGDLS